MGTETFEEWADRMHPSLMARMAQAVEGGDWPTVSAMVRDGMVSKRQVRGAVTTTTTRASLALALHQYLRAAEDEVGKARTKRDEEIRHLYAEGMSGHQIAELLGLTPRSIYNVVNAGDEQ